MMYSELLRLLTKYSYISREKHKNIKLLTPRDKEFKIEYILDLQDFEVHHRTGHHSAKVSCLSLKES